MAEEFQGGIYSTRWWSASRKGDERPMTAPSTASCSLDITEIGSTLNWTPDIIGGGHMEDVHRLQTIDSTGIAPFMTDYNRPSPSLDWNQALLERVDEGFQAIPLQDYRSEGGSVFASQGFMGDSCFSESICSSTILPGSYQDSCQPPWPQFFNHLKASSPPQQMHLSDNIVFYPPLQPQFERKSNLSMSKSTPEIVRELSADTKKSGGEPAVSFKKARMETPSSLPTFKVRKEKLGDRITALQQLVSPFGKTDTASVLHEAIDYIKFLHEQVSVLSTPYLQNAPTMQPQRDIQKQKSSDSSHRDLRSRGLCLVPLSSTLAVASEPMADFWTPSFGGTYR